MNEAELTGEINSLKKRLEEQTQLFEDLDNDHQQEVKQLKQTNNELLDKIRLLESKLRTSEQNIAELNEMVDHLKKLSNKPAPAPQTEIISMASESFIADFDNLQDQVESLQEEQKTLKAELEEKNSTIDEMIRVNEGLQKLNAEQEDMIEAMGSTNKRLSFELKVCNLDLLCLREQAETLELKGYGGASSLKDEIEKKEAADKISSLLNENSRLLEEVDQLKKSQSSKADLDVLRSSLKEMTEKKLQLQKKLERLMDVDEDNRVLRDAAQKMKQEIEYLEKERDRLTKLHSAAESRASENSFISSKRFKKEEDSMASFRTPQKKPARSSSVSVSARPIRKKSEYIELKHFGGTSRMQELDHLKSHYNPSLGVFDASYNETPDRARKLETPRKEDQPFKRTLRSNY